MSINKAIKIITARGGKVYFENNVYRVWFSNHHYGDYTGRKLVGFARSFCSLPAKKMVKKDYSIYSRRSVRDAINMENFDSIYLTDRERFIFSNRRNYD